MMKYEKYKPSEVHWLGNKPLHWRTYRIDWITAFVRGNTGLKKDELLEIGDYVALQYGKTYKVDEVDNSFNFFVNSEYYKRNQTVKRGDTILISTSETIEDLGHSCFYNRDDIGLLGGEQILLKPKTKFINAKYLYYHSKIFCSDLRKYATGLKVFRFNTDELKRVFIAVPTISEQTAIAEYLDAKTQAIDKKINLLTQKAETYKELRKSMINDAVCKGLDKSVKLKESGIDWIGKIPEHWELRMFKQISYMKGRIGWQGLKFSEFSDDVNQPYLITGMNFKGGKIRWEEVYHISEERYNEAPEIQLKVNDILMTKDGTIGKLLFVDYLPGKASLNSHLLVLRPLKNKYHAKYLYYQLESESFIGHIEHNKYGTTFYGLTQEAMGRFITILPLLSEQTAIANYLDEKTQKIDAIVSNIGKQIDTLKELRKTLINDVVTGKIKVSEPLIDID